MERGSTRRLKTPLIPVPNLTGKCKGATVLVKDESKNEFGTFKDRRNAELLDMWGAREQALLFQITNGNSGYSLGNLAKKKGDHIKVVNFVPLGTSLKIRKKLEECSIVVELDLSKKRDFEEMREIAIREAGFEGPMENTLGVEGFDLGNGYRMLASELVFQLRDISEGLVPTHVFCPVGEGELLVEIAKELKKEYPENTPKLVGVTIDNNILAHLEEEEGVGFLRIEGIGNEIAEKLASGFSKLKEDVARLVSEGRVKIEVVKDDAEIARTYFELKEMGISSEPSASVAFAGAFAYGLTEKDLAVIINSGKGIFDDCLVNKVYSEGINFEKRDSRGRNALMNAIEAGDFGKFKGITEVLGMEMGEHRFLFFPPENEEGKTKETSLGLYIFSKFLEDNGDLEKAEEIGKRAEELERVENTERYRKLQENELKARIERAYGPCDFEGKNALIIAIISEQPEIAELILEHIEGYAEDILTKKDRDGKTAIQYALDKGYWGIAERIAECLNARHCTSLNNCGENILHQACRGGAEAENLIKKMIDVRYPNSYVANVKNNEGKYPLELALDSGVSLETLKMLILVGERERTWKILDLELAAIEAGKYEAGAAQKAVASVFPCVNEAVLVKLARSGDMEKLRVLLEAGILDSNAVRERATLLLVDGVECGKISLVRFLMDAGVAMEGFTREETLERVKRNSKGDDMEWVFEKLMYDGEE